MCSIVKHNGFQLIKELIAASVNASIEAAKKVLICDDLDPKAVSLEVILDYLKPRFNVEYVSYQPIDKYVSILIEQADLQPLNKDVLSLLTNAEGNEYEQVTESQLSVWIDPLNGFHEISITKDITEGVIILIGIAYKGKPIAGVINQPFLKTSSGNPNIIWGIKGVDVYHNRNEDGLFELVKMKNTSREKNVLRIIANNEDKTWKLYDILEENEIYKKYDIKAIDCSNGSILQAISLIDEEIDCLLYPYENLKLYEICALEAIVRALNGKCTSFEYETYDYSKPNDSKPNLFGFIMTLKSHDVYTDVLTQLKGDLEQMMENLKRLLENYDEYTSMGGKGQIRFPIKFQTSSIDFKSKVDTYCPQFIYQAIFVFFKYWIVHEKVGPYGIIDSMHDKWELYESRPRMIISVCGSNFHSEEYKELLISSLAKVAAERHAWIITNGFYNGVSDELANIRKNNVLNPSENVVILGISRWNKVSHSNNLLKTSKAKENQSDLINDEYESFYNPYNLKEEKDKRFLDPYHTHLLMIDTIDDLNFNQIKNDIKLGLIYKYGIPTIRIVYGNEIDFLVDIEEAIDWNIPCLFLEGTGKIGGLCKGLIELHEKVRKNEINEEIDDYIKKVIKANWGTEDVDEYIGKIRRIVENPRLEEFISNYKWNPTIDLKTDSPKFDAAIYAAILKLSDRLDLLDKMKLLMEWDRYDIAKQYLKSRKELEEIKELETLEDSKESIKLKKELLKKALLTNRHQFVRFLMENSIDENQTTEYLKEIEYKVTYSGYSEKLLKLFGVNYKSFVGYILSLKIYDYDPNEKSSKDNRDLFLYFLGLNYEEMVKMYLFKGTNEILAALIAAKFYRKLDKLESNYNVTDRKRIFGDPKLSFTEMANNFETLAYNLLQYCYKKDKKKSREILLIKAKEFGNVSCFKIVQNDFEITHRNEHDSDNQEESSSSDETDVKKFVAHECFQEVVSHSWHGDEDSYEFSTKKIYYLYLSLCFILFPISYIPFMIFTFLKTAKIIDKKSKRKWLFMFFEMYNIPETKYIFDGIIYIFFLTLYSYMMLCNYYSISNYTLSPYETNLGLPISIIEIVLIIWRFSYVAIMLKSFFKDLFFVFQTGYYFKIVNYSDLFKLFGNTSIYVLVIFIVSTTFRFYDNLFVASRILLCFELMFWYLKFLVNFSVSKELGPKLEMIKLMITQLFQFLRILIVIFFAFGVVFQALMYHNQRLDAKILENVFYGAYSIIAGESGMLGLMLDEKCTGSLDNDTYTQDDCPDYTGKKFALGFYTVYVVISVILAINLLIAIFNLTFDKVNKKANRIFASQRYKFLIDEYIDRPALPAPFILISLSYQTMFWFIIFCYNLSRKEVPSKDPEIDASLSSKKNDTDTTKETNSEVKVDIKIEKVPFKNQISPEVEASLSSKKEDIDTKKETIKIEEGEENKKKEKKTFSSSKDEKRNIQWFFRTVYKSMMIKEDTRIDDEKRRKEVVELIRWQSLLCDEFYSNLLNKDSAKK